jgi:zinc and cadmium transporter
MTLTLILLASAAGGLLSVLLAAGMAWGVVKPRPETWLAFAVGALIAAALLGMIPEALERGLDPHALGAWLAVGLGGFFLLDKLARAHHAHTDPLRAVVPAIVLGDGLHNFVDGVLIAAAFLADPHLGLATTVAVTLHEIPQELGDFAVLVAAGLSKCRALLLNLASGLATVAGGVTGYLLLDSAQAALPVVLALAAASFLYIAIASLVPVLHTRHSLAAGAWQGALILAGGSAVFLGHAVGHAH